MCALRIAGVAAARVTSRITLTPSPIRRFALGNLFDLIMPLNGRTCHSTDSTAMRHSTVLLNRPTLNDLSKQVPDFVCSIDGVLLIDFECPTPIPPNSVWR